MRVKPRLAISSRLKVPVWKVLDRSYPLWEHGKAEAFAQLVSRFEESEDGFPVVTLYGVRLRMPGYPRNFDLVALEPPLWERFYLPPFPCDGKTVLDAGAGFGETAAFYCSKGASKVICVESDPLAVKLLRDNVERGGLPVSIREKRFEAADLEGVDFAKVDIEGGERVLLGLGELHVPCVIETHRKDIRSGLCENQGFHEVHRIKRQRSLVSNY